jgi:hypothetical protein
MRAVVAAFVVLLVLAPAAQAQVKIDPVPSPTTQQAIDVSFSAPGTDVHYDCEHDFPEGAPEFLPGCTSPLGLRDLVEGLHTVRVTAIADGVTSEDSVSFLVVAEEPPALEITAPADGAVLAQPAVRLTGTTAADTTVAVFDGDRELGAAALDDGTWTYEATGLAEGAHTLRVVASDTAGNTAEAVLHVTVDTVAPAIAFAEVPASPTNRSSFDIGFGASEPAGFSCALDEAAPEPCEPPFEARALADGTHVLRVTATDAAGNTTTETAAVTVDTTPPSAVVPEPAGTAVFTFAGEAGARYECRLTGPSGDSGFGACGSPKAYGDLPPGDYAFTLQTIDAAGNRAAAAATRTFTIADATPPSTPPAIVVPAIAPALPVIAPAVELGRTLVARTVRGKVLVRRPASGAPVDLGAVAGIPVGTEIDARHGRVRLTAAARPGKAAQRAEFFGGVFVVTQASNDVVDISLSEPLGSCKKKTGTRVRKLWGDGKGRFRTHGLRAVVTVRGTRWLVQDSCEGTLTRVTQGLVSVRDTGARKTVLVRAGRKYLAAPRKRK